MSFNTALSGLRAASQNLSVTGNNIANSSTTGFKASRAEFGDVYANSILGTGSRSAGSGVLVSAISQQFDQGNISITNNNLDLAISGSGFFVLSKDGSLTYTRSGTFSVDNAGYVVANTGARLQGFGAGATGTIVSGALSDLKIQTQDIAPNATGELGLTVNLDSRESAPATTPFSATDPNSFNWSTSATVYDSLGNSHTLVTYYAKSATPPAAPATGTNWDVYTTLDDGATPNALGTLTFDSNGSLVAPSPAALPDSWTMANGAADLNFSVNYKNSTQYGSTFATSALTQDGYASGRLTGVSVDDTGIVFATYSNGQSLALGQVALANFPNAQGLTSVGNTQWAESFDSGQPVIGAPQSGALGAIQSGALEDSNVDLSSQLVNLILAQRDYQANAKTIETENTVTQTIINLRS
jgi:flagellar hook protein FlgE